MVLLRAQSFPSIEHALQATKFSHSHPQVISAILSAESAKDAKSIAANFVCQITGEMADRAARAAAGRPATASNKAKKEV